METFSVSRNIVWFTRSGSEESSQSRNLCVPRIRWKGFRLFSLPIFTLSLPIYLIIVDLIEIVFFSYDGTTLQLQW